MRDKTGVEGGAAGADEAGEGSSRIFAASFFLVDNVYVA